MKTFLRNWKIWRDNMLQVLSMNQRNLRYVYPFNPRRHFPIADNKLLAKTVLAEHDVPVPATYYSYQYFFELRTLEQDLTRLESFVIKPARGRAGGGIIVIDHREGDEWVSVGGTRYDIDALRKHMSDIVFGIHSFSLADEAIVEAKVEPHAFMREYSPLGLADIRVILHQHAPVMAMMRVPTQASDGKANIHQGAIGVGIDMTNGITTHAMHQGRPVETHPDTGVALLHQQIPFWSELLQYSRQAAEIVPLKYLGVDIVLSSSGPMILEVNARPGIEIQNANLAGMRPVLEHIQHGIAGDRS